MGLELLESWYEENSVQVSTDGFQDQEGRSPIYSETGEEQIFRRPQWCAGTARCP